MVFDDPAAKLIAGYKEVTEHEFWLHGQPSTGAVMPRTLICEAAGQLCNYHACTHELTHGRPIGVGAFKRITFKNQVRPGCRLDILAKLTAARPGVSVAYAFQCYVSRALVCDGWLLGVALAL